MEGRIGLVTMCVIHFSALKKVVLGFFGIDIDVGIKQDTYANPEKSRLISLITKCLTIKSFRNFFYLIISLFFNSKNILLCNRKVYQSFIAHARE